MLLSKKIKDYEGKYRNKELKISAEISNFLNIQSKIELKIVDFITTGIIYSVSMNSIKLIFSEDKVLPLFLQNKNIGNICFKPVSNSVSNQFTTTLFSVKLVNTSTYSTQDREYNLLSLEFLNPLSEELAIKIGKLLDLKLGQNQRIYDRITVNKDSIRKLNLSNETAMVEINSVRYKCIIKDLSYGGALLISYLNEKLEGTEDLNLIFDFINLDREVLVQGKIINLSIIQTPKGKVLALGVLFNEEKIPLDYSMAIHDYFN